MQSLSWCSSYRLTQDRAKFQFFSFFVPEPLPCLGGIVYEELDLGLRLDQSCDKEADATSFPPELLVLHHPTVLKLQHLR